MSNPKLNEKDFSGTWWEIARSGINKNFVSSYNNVKWTFTARNPGYYSVKMFTYPCGTNQILEYDGYGIVKNNDIQIAIFRGTTTQVLGSFRVYHTDYTRYAILGRECEAIVLARQPQISASIIPHLLGLVESSGYNASELLVYKGVVVPAKTGTATTITNCNPIVQNTVTQQQYIVPLPSTQRPSTQLPSTQLPSTQRPSTQLRPCNEGGVRMPTVVPTTTTTTRGYDYRIGGYPVTTVTQSPAKSFVAPEVLEDEISKSQVVVNQMITYPNVTTTTSEQLRQEHIRNEVMMEERLKTQERGDRLKEKKLRNMIREEQTRDRLVEEELRNRLEEERVRDSIVETELNGRFEEERLRDVASEKELTDRFEEERRRDIATETELNDRFEEQIERDILEEQVLEDREMEEELERASYDVMGREGLMSSMAEQGNISPRSRFLSSGYPPSEEKDVRVGSVGYRYPKTIANKMNVRDNVAALRSESPMRSRIQSVKSSEKIPAVQSVRRPLISSPVRSPIRAQLPVSSIPVIQPEVAVRNSPLRSSPAQIVPEVAFRNSPIRQATVRSEPEVAIRNSPIRPAAVRSAPTGALRLPVSRQSVKPDALSPKKRFPMSAPAKARSTTLNANLMADGVSQYVPSSRSERKVLQKSLFTPNTKGRLRSIYNKEFDNNQLDGLNDDYLDVDDSDGNTTADFYEGLNRGTSINEANDALSRRYVRRNDRWI